MARQGDVHAGRCRGRRGRRDLVVAADAAGGALAELGAGLGGDLTSDMGRLLDVRRADGRGVAVSLAWALGARQATHDGPPRRSRSRSGGVPRRGNRSESSRPDRRTRQPRREAHGSACPSNRLVTEPSSKTSRIARAISGAIDSTVSLSKRRSSGIGSVFGDDDLADPGSSSAGRPPGRTAPRAWPRR